MALRRPPRVDEYRLYRVQADTGYEAELLAQGWAANSPDVAMPVESVVIDWPEDGISCLRPGSGDEVLESTPLS